MGKKNEVVRKIVKEIDQISSNLTSIEVAEQTHAALMKNNVGREFCKVHEIHLPSDIRYEVTSAHELRLYNAKKGVNNRFFASKLARCVTKNGKAISVAQTTDYKLRVDAVLQEVETKKGKAYALSIPLAPSKEDRIALKIVREEMDVALRKGHQLNLASETVRRQLKSAVRAAIAKQSTDLTEEMIKIRAESATKRAIGNVNALKGHIGLKTGVMTFLFDEGVSAYRFFAGDMNGDTFAYETAKNLGKALMVGTATHVTVMLGATPTGWIIMGIGIGVYTASDFAFTCLEREFAASTITFDDILGQLPTELQRRKNAMTFDGYQTIFDYQGQSSALEYRGRPSVYDCQGKPSTFDHKGAPSAFDL